MVRVDCSRDLGRKGVNMAISRTTFLPNLSFLTVLSLTAPSLSALGLAGCGDDTKTTAGVETMTTGASVNVTITGNDTEPTTTVNPTTGLGKLDLPDDGETVDLGCNADGKCNLLDILFVIDNSGTMGEEQKNLSLIHI